MRILVLNYEFPPLGGGAANAAWFLSKEWGKMGIKTDIVTTWFNSLDEISYLDKNVTVYRVKSLRKKMEQSNPIEMLSYVFDGFKKSVHLVSKNSYDLTIAFFSIPSGLIALKLFKKFNIPYIVLLRGGDVPGFHSEKLGLLHTVTMPFTKMVWKKASRIIANSCELCKLANITANKINRTVENVPNGVDILFFKPAKQFRKRSPFVFLFVGRFAHQKNLMFFLSQFETANKNNAARLILCGDGPEKKKLLQKIETSPILKNSVCLKPWTAKKELPSIYQSAHCFINPSIQEGMPNTVLEAMACGLPVIASNIGGNNQLVEHGKNGYLFDFEEKNSLSNYMQKIINNDQYESMCLHSRHLAETKYSWSVSAEAIVKDIKYAV